VGGGCKTQSPRNGLGKEKLPESAESNLRKKSHIGGNSLVKKKIAEKKKKKGGNTQEEGDDCATWSVGANPKSSKRDRSKQPQLKRREEKEI